jgi:hypothetical protein
MQQRPQRRHAKHQKTFRERLAEQAWRLQEAAAQHSAGSRARQVETASHIHDRVTSPGSPHQICEICWLSGSNRDHERLSSLDRKASQ